MSIADGPMVLVVGSEGRGLSRVVANACDMLVSIPMVSGNESLNAGIAASVALYEIAGVRAAAADAHRQHQPTGQVRGESLGRRPDTPSAHPQ